MSIFDHGYEAKVCRNCGNDWREKDKYCRYCGAPLDQPGYKVKSIACIYGPMPVTRKHTCPACNYTWENRLMIDREEFCPLCGSAVSVEKVDPNFMKVDLSETIVDPNHMTDDLFETIEGRAITDNEFIEMIEKYEAEMKDKND